MAFYTKYIKWIMECIEIYIPTISFAILFIVFVIQVFFRYFLNNPLTWPFEVTLIGFIWTTLLGACLAQRNREHVEFTLIYDLMPAKWQGKMRILANVLIITAFIIGLYPSWDFIQFMEFEKSTVLRIPFSWIFLPFFIFLIIIIGRLTIELFQDIKLLLIGTRN
jgi:TRAP-type C4-dicarboxylate transport system permease small subunit